MLFTSTAAFADVITLKDGRQVEGEIVEETSTIVKIKLKFGVVTFPKSQITKISKQSGTKSREETAKPNASVEAAKKESDLPVSARNFFKNGFYDYLVKRPSSSWLIKRSPPEPLVDVLFYHFKTEASVSVSVQSDPEPDTPLSKVSLERFRQGIKSKLQEKFTEVRTLTSSKEKVDGRIALRTRHTGISRLTKKAMTMEEWLFKAEDRIYVLFSYAPSGRFGDAEPEMNKIIDSFAIVKGKEFEDGTFSSFDHFFTVQVPTNWKLDKTDDGCVIKSSFGDSQFEVIVESDTERESLLKISEMRLKDLSEQRKSFVRLGSSTANILGTVVQIIDYQYYGAGPKRGREIFIGSDQRLYQIKLTWPENNAEREKALTEMLDEMIIQRNLTSKTSFEDGIKAIEANDRGDEALRKNQFGSAISHYETALRHFPNFAFCLNNMAITYSLQKNPEEFFNTMRKAYRLYPEHRLMRSNMGEAYNSRGVSFLNARNYKKAAADFERALRFLPDSEHKQVKSNLSICYINEGIDKLNKRQTSSALASFKKAQKYDKNNPKLKGYLSDAYYYAAVQYFNKRQWFKAKSNAKKALKANPNNGQARSLIQKIAEIKKRG